MRPFWRCPWTWAILLLALGLRGAGISRDLPWHGNQHEHACFRDLHHMAHNLGRPWADMRPPLYTYIWGLAMLPVGASGIWLGFFESPQAFLDAYTLHPSLFYLTGRFLSLLFGMLAILRLGRLAEGRYGGMAGRIAMLILAIDPHHVLVSQTADCTAMSIWMFLVALGAALRYADGAAPLRAVLWAGLLSGVAGATKELSGLVLFALLGMILQREGFRLRRMLQACTAAGAGYALANPWAVLRLRDSLQHLVNLMAWQHVESAEGGVVGRLDFWERSVAWASTFPWLLRVAAPVLVLWILWRMPKDRILAAFVAGYTLFFVVFGDPRQRHLLPAAIVIALLAGGFLAQLGPAWRRWALGLLLVGLVPSLAFSCLRGWLKTRPSTWQQAATWMVRNLPEGEGIFSDDKFFLSRFPSAHHEIFQGGRRQDLLMAWREQRGGKLFNIPVDLFNDSMYAVDPEEFVRRGIGVFVLTDVGRWLATSPHPSIPMTPEEKRQRQEGIARLDREAVLIARFSPLKSGGDPPEAYDDSYPGVFNTLSYLRGMRCWGPVVSIYRWVPEGRGGN